MGKACPALDIYAPGCDPQLQELVFAELDDFQPTAIQEQDDSSRLRAFFSTSDAREAAARALAASFANRVYVEALDVEDEDWAARSQAELRAITVGRIVVAPPWDVAWDVGSDPRTVQGSEVAGRIRAEISPVRGSDPVLVVIRPSMGFGTGHHATTRLMLRALQTLPLEGRTVLDIGCGSGVLAIAAVRLGAGSAVGIDVDPDALANAEENAGLNDMGDHVRFEEGDFREIPARADIVMANLTGGLLERSAARLAELVQPDGHLIVSGFMNTEKTAVVSALEHWLASGKIDQEDEWMCGVFRM